MSVISASLRSRVRAGVEPIARLFGRVGLTPNMLTLIGFAIACIGAFYAAIEAWLIAGIVVAFGAIFDLFDGALARVTNRTSAFGAFLDSTMDRAGEAVVYLGVAAALVGQGHTVASLLAIAAASSSFLVSYVRARSESLGFSPGTGMASVGLAPREVRVVILVIGLIAAAVLPQPHPIYCITTPCPQPLGPEWALIGALGLITVLATITTIQRMFFVYRQSKSNNQEVNN
jgi:phosphatidylglycerophosphate synthase